MNIAVVIWYVNNIGGINTWTENFISGAIALGHKVSLFHCTSQISLNCSETEKVMRSRRYHLLPGKHLSYRKDRLKESIETLNSLYDLLVFAHPSPHPTKANLKGENVEGWKSFYTDTVPFKMCVFHDRHWDRTNLWIKDVVEYVDYVHAAQHHFVPAVKRFTEGQIPYGWDMFPMKLDSDLFSRKKKNIVILPAQWLSIKNHRYLVPHLSRVRIPVHSYNSGQTYYTLMEDIKRNFREDHHWDVPKTYNKTSIHNHYGFIEYSELIEKMSESKFSLDLSIQGMTNMTHWEPMTVGCVSLLERRVVEDEHCEIPEDCCLSYNLEEVVPFLNRLSKVSSKIVTKIRERGWSLVQNCDRVKVVDRILSSVNRYR